MTNILRYVRTPVHDFGEEDRAFEALLKAGLAPERVRISPKGDVGKAQGNGHLPGTVTSPRRKGPTRPPDGRGWPVHAYEIMRRDSDIPWTRTDLWRKLRAIGNVKEGTVQHILSQSVACGFMKRHGTSRNASYTLTDRGKTESLDRIRAALSERH